MNEYALKGPQIEPSASYWMYCPHPCVVHIDDLRKKTDDPSSPDYFPPYPVDKAWVEQEFNELVGLSGSRNDPCALVNTKPCKKLPAVCTQEKIPNAIGCRRPISKLLNLTPPALGAVVVNRLPGEQVIRTGKGLARAVEAETPGIFHRHALNYLIRLRNWSPPRQALVWAALDTAIASALQAAWYYKWIASGRANTARRQRPAEYAKDKGLPLNVLFDRPDELNPAYNLCPDGRPIGGVWPDNMSGTPRHPAYPSGHSTYAGAASEILSYFFGSDPTPVELRDGAPATTLKEELDNMADNIGMGRLWGGIHWRSDHEAGLKLGRTVACMVLQQIADIGSVECKSSGASFVPGAVGAFKLCTPPPEDVDQCNFKDTIDDCDMKEMPPARAKLECEAKAIAAACGKPKKLEPPCKSTGKESTRPSLDRSRGVQQNSK
jgi:hypothetical protein